MINDLKNYANTSFFTHVCLVYLKFWDKMQYPIMFTSVLCNSCKCLIKFYMLKILLPTTISYFFIKTPLFHIFSFTQISRQRTRFLKLQFFHSLLFMTKCFHAERQKNAKNAISWEGKRRTYRAKIDFIGTPFGIAGGPKRKDF